VFEHGVVVVEIPAERFKVTASILRIRNDSAVFIVVSDSKGVVLLGLGLADVMDWLYRVNRALVYAERIERSAAGMRRCRTAAATSA
jgi:hypothetical protein